MSFRGLRERAGPHLGALLERRTLIAVGLLALALWGFAGLYDEVREGDTADFDHAVLQLFRTPGQAGQPDKPIGPVWLESAVRDVTALGGHTILIFLTLAVAGYLALARKPAAAVFVLVAVLGALLASQLLKGLIDRPRPDLAGRLVDVYTESFPSGHATGSAAAYLTLGSLLSRMHPERRLKVYVMALAVLMALAIGVSRLYLGVHWPSDVLAGWTLGAGWALLCWTVARVLQHRGRIEYEPEVHG